MLITFYRTAADGGLRYYSVNDRQGHLFSRYSFTATWGRQLSTGQEKLYSFDTAEEMERKLKQIVKQRLRSGYKVLYSYFGKSSIELDAVQKSQPRTSPGLSSLRRQA
ncbi:MAG: WGR domain-containing protein [Spirochaeta sp.]